MILYTIALNYRSFLRSNTTFFINLIGLSTALASALLIYLWIRDELSFDKFHEKDERLFQVVENIRNNQGIVTREATPIGMAELVLESLPEVEHAAAVTPMAWFPKFIIDDKGNRLKSEGKFVGRNFLDIFSYPLLQGDKESALQERYSIVISESLAQKLYGSPGKAMGQLIPWQLSHIKQECIVTGVFKDIPRNSSEQFELILPIDLLGEIMGFDPKDIGPPGPGTFLVLNEGADPMALSKKTSDLMASKTNAKDADFHLIPYSRKYLYGKFENGVQVETRLKYVRLFTLLALLIICIACINFMNLTTANAATRMKEIGVKKVVGASRKTLALQYMSESIFMSLIALVAAMVIAKLLLPQFNMLTGKMLIFDFSLTNLMVYIGIAILTGVVAGSYPSLYLSGFKALTVLKGHLRGSFGELMARRGLVVFQFAISIIVIVAAFVIYQQMEFVQTKNLGYDKENLIYFELEGTVATDHATFLSELRKIPGVVNASAMFGNIVGTIGRGMETSVNNKVIPFHWLGVDYGMIETLGIEMVSGRTFSSAHNDSSRIIFNQAAIDAMGIQDPVGRVIAFGDERVEIIGVTRNFHLRSLHEAITPLAFRIERNGLWNIFVRLDKTRPDETLATLEQIYKQFNPGFALDYRFVDQAYQSQYASENRVAALSIWFAGLAILVSCLGLFGLSAYSAERRTKEIGIRKVLGSSATAIVILLCRDFVVLVFIAVVISIPVSYYLLSEWLNNFAYSIALEWWIFIMAGFVSMVIALLTTARQALKASGTDPARCLRTE